MVAISRILGTDGLDDYVARYDMNIQYKYRDLKQRSDKPWESLIREGKEDIAPPEVAKGEAMGCWFTLWIVFFFWIFFLASTLAFSLLDAWFLP